MYLLLPYLCNTAQLLGWREGRRRRGEKSAARGRVQAPAGAPEEPL
jgi:hypothetical protein